MCPWSCGLCSGCHTPNHIRRGFPTALHLQVCDSNTHLLFFGWPISRLLEKPSIVSDRRDAAHSFFRIDSGNPLPNNPKYLCYPSDTRTKGSCDATSEAGSHATRCPSSQGSSTHLPLSKVYCDTSEQLFQMHHARGQRRLERMTGRGVASANDLDRRTVPQPHVAARGAARIGHPFAKLGGNNGLSSASTCVFFSLCSHFIILTHYRATMCLVERFRRTTWPLLTRLVKASAP
jgi:hypothetical protein